MQLPIDEKNLVVSDPILTDEVVYVSAYPANTARPVTIADLAASTLILSEVHWRSEDPLRRGLLERARAAGVTLEPDIEVEFQEAAIILAAHGVGDTLASAFVLRNAPNANQLNFTSLDPPYLEHYAFHLANLRCPVAGNTTLHLHCPPPHRNTDTVHGTATAIVDPRRHRPNARADHADACCGSPLQMRHDPWPLPRRHSGADNAALSAGPHAPSGDMACPHVA